MKKIIFFSLFLILGLVASQVVPQMIGGENYTSIKPILNALLYTSLAFIMINVGREFELDKSRWRSYTTDYFIAMATAAVPWIFVCIYFMYLMPSGSFGDWDSWKENLLLSRFAAPTSAGILFTMLAAANLKRSWIYKKTQVLAIFDDLDTILLMIPLQIMMIGMKWQLAVILIVVIFSLWFGWKKLNTFKLNQKWWALLGYGVLLAISFEGAYHLTKHHFGAEGAVHVEVLLPAFVLGMVIKTNHKESKKDKQVAGLISYLFMFLVGMSAPLVFGSLADAATTTAHSVTASIPEMSWGEIGFHVLIITILSNLGKMFPLFAYRDRMVKERLALSIGMFTRGEVGAGIIFIAIGYGLGGPLLTIALLTLVSNLLLTGIFVVIVKKLAQKVAQEREALGLSIEE
ncbi:MAG: sodium:proton antiporter [Rikenellaceae bacterium]